jgi:predicted nuclease of predicted toxin-antitoxin system
MRVLVDMNLSPRWVGALAAAGIEAEHWSVLGAVSAPDVEIMAFARRNDYVVLTYDLDFSAILAAPRATSPVSCKFVPTMSTRIRSANQ